MAVCQVCEHDKRAVIEIGLVLRVPLRQLAARYDVHKDSLYRHRRSHLTPAQVAAILAAQNPSAIDLEALQRTESEGLLGNLIAQRARLQSLAELAMADGDVRGATRCEGAITENLQLVAKLLGQLAVRHEHVHTALLAHPQYVQARTAIIQALKPFPQAAHAVAVALGKVEAAAAADLLEAHPPQRSLKLVAATVEGDDS